jgi:4-amino-4-deoxy-L-arabinose transferase
MKKVLLLLLCFAAAYLIPLGSRPLVTPDEFRYAQIPYEMLESGNFAAPQMFSQPYFEKPALGYWMTAANFYLFGYNNFAIRLAASLSTGLTALLVGLLIFVSFRDKRFAALGILTYLWCGMVYALGIFAVLDAPMALFSTAALFCSYAYLQEDRSRLSKAVLLILCGVFCGLGFMVKGIPALVAPGLGTAGFLIWQKRWKQFVIMPYLPIIFMILTVLPWALAVHRADGDFWRYFIEVEHIERFTKGGVGQHKEPWYFLLPFFIGGAFPAAFLLFSGWGNFKKIVRQMLGVPLYRFATCSAVLPLILFSCSGGKLPTYILPCFPGIAVLIAGFTVTALRGYEKSERNLNILFNCCGWFFGVAGILAVPAGYVLKFCFDGNEKLTVFSVSVLAAGASFAAGGMLLLLSEKKNIRHRLCFFLLLFLIPMLVIPFFITPEIKLSKMPLRELQNMKKCFSKASPDVHIVTAPSVMHAAAWVFRTTDIQTLNTVGEMDYADFRARKENRRPVEISTDEFVKHLRNRNRKDVIYIFRTGRAVRNRRLSSPDEYVGKYLSARYYPGQKKAEQGAGKTK